MEVVEVTISYYYLLYLRCMGNKTGTTWINYKGRRITIKRFGNRLATNGKYIKMVDD